jgi:hypothetical protein
MNFMPQDLIKDLPTKQLEAMLANVSIVKEVIEVELNKRKEDKGQ